MDIERLKTIVTQSVAGVILSFMAFMICDKMGLSDVQSWLVVGGGFIASMYYITKKEDKEREAALQELEEKVEQHIEEEVERRMKDKKAG